MNSSRRQFLQCAAATIALPLGSRLALGQVWPTKPIRAIVPTSPGTAVDILTRLALKELSLQLGQPIIIDSRPGAGGTIAAAVVANAEPDGYTILAESTHTLAPFTHAHLTFDPLRDFSPVIPLGTMPLVLVCAPSKGIKSIHELVAAAKAAQGSFSYASGGIGTTTHLSVERLQLSAGFYAVHVPFRGAKFATDVMSGRIDFAYIPIGSGIDLIRDGRLLPLAVSSRARAVLLPDVPTTLESGYANSDFIFYVGMFVPAKTPRSIVERLNHDTGMVLGTAGMRERLATIGAEPMLMTTAEFDAFISEELVANEELIKTIGLKPL